MKYWIVKDMMKQGDDGKKEEERKMKFGGEGRGLNKQQGSGYSVNV